MAQEFFGVGPKTNLKNKNKEATEKEKKDESARTKETFEKEYEAVDTKEFAKDALKKQPRETIEKKPLNKRANKGENYEAAVTDGHLARDESLETARA